MGRLALRPWRSASILGGLGLLALVVLLTFAADRSVLIEAETSGLRLSFSGEANAWRFDTASRCVLRASPQPRLASGQDAETAPCSPVLFEIQSLTDHAINWRAGSVVDMVIDSAGALSIHLVERGQTDLPLDSYIIVPAAAWARHGALTFSGTLRLGEPIASGSRNYLHSGRWEMRQSGFATSLIRDIVEVVKRGEVTLGASVEIYSGARPATMFGSITPSHSANSAVDMRVTALSQKGPVELQLRYFGLQDPTILRPDWIDRVVSSSTLMGILAIMTFVATGYQLLQSSWSVGRPASRRGKVGSRDTAADQPQLPAAAGADIPVPADIATALPPAAAAVVARADPSPRQPGE